jgi:GNAT superfamily N-acetyltransferase
VPRAPKDRLRSLWPELLENPMLHHVVAELDSRLVAACTLVVVPSLTGGARPFGLIDDVVTRRDYRRRGLGTAALAGALELAWAAGCYKVMVLTGSKEPGVHRFYQRAGFQRDGKTGFIARPPAKAD